MSSSFSIETFIFDENLPKGLLKGISKALSMLLNGRRLLEMPHVNILKLPLYFLLLGILFKHL